MYSMPIYFPIVLQQTAIIPKITKAGKVAELAEVKKDQKYSLLGATYLFTPVAIETSGAIGPRSRVFLRELGRRVRWESGEPRATSYLLQ